MPQISIRWHIAEYFEEILTLFDVNGEKWIPFEILVYNFVVNDIRTGTPADIIYLQIDIIHLHKN